LVAEIRFHQRDFFYEVREWQRGHGRSNGRISQPPTMQNKLSPALKRLAASISTFAETLTRDEDKIELTSAADRCLATADSLTSWLEQDIEEAVYWVEAAGRNRQQTKLICTPIEVGAVLRDELFNQAGTAI